MLISVLALLVIAPSNILAATIFEYRVPTAFTFARDLRFGRSVSPDVMHLQNLLNMNASTTVALIGKGSNRALTAYYGPATRSAVDRFQKLYAADIAFAAGTGTSSILFATSSPVKASSTFSANPSVVDVYTRAVMNRLLVVYADMRMQSLQTLNKGSAASTTSVVAAQLTSGMAVAGGSVIPVIENFGGQSTSMVTCTCSSNLLIYVHDVRGPTLPLIYQPGATILYMWYRPTSGVNMLGQYVSGGQCLIYSGNSCESGGTPIGTMTQLGTSLAI